MPRDLRNPVKLVICFGERLSRRLVGGGVDAKEVMRRATEYMYLFFFGGGAKPVLNIFFITSPANRPREDKRKKRIVYRLQISGKSKFKLSFFLIKIMKT